ncbi:MAG TPA: amidohydrolase family protein [Bryobacteraceae bacterium]|nr:amidohydrolase family protein [Bryobacteraceae bacterium]
MRAVCLVLLLLPPLGAQQFDLVIRSGRVIDPASGLDAVRNVGISGGKIQEISPDPLEGRTSIDATGLVVAPGFIDLHSHGQDAENYRAKAMDGVTTAMEMEVGVADVRAWYSKRQSQSLINYGAAAGHIPARMRVMHDPGGFLPTRDAAHRAATDEEIEEIRRQIEEGLKQGAAGVGLGVQYTPGATRAEILEMFRAAASFGAACFVHIRGVGDGSIPALEEVMADSAATGAPVHVAHITSSGLRATPRLLAMIGEARARKLDITTELYPYTAAMSGIESALFDPGWQDTMGIGYHDLQWAETGERLTADSFARYRKIGGGVILHMIPPSALEAALASPFVMIASDGGLRNGKGHPRSSGTYARVLGHYVRETGAVTLTEAIRRMSLMPAERLEQRVPMMRNKGRIREGADADLTLFDPATVADAATYEHPALYSTGIRYVLVNGVAVVSDGKLQAAAPGRAVRAAVK